MNAHELGAIITGTVIELAPYGAFIECDNGQKGLLHISEVSRHFVAAIGDRVKLGQKLRLKVIAIDPGNNYLRLSLKQCPAVPREAKRPRVRIKIPDQEVNFQPLEEALPKWIEAAMQKDEGNHETD
ncbi:MAG: S1 RNA-binding domain-containing protein [Bacilli bacterium]|jgi:general stress protein 13